MVKKIDKIKMEKGLDPTVSWLCFMFSSNCLDKNASILIVNVYPLKTV